MTAIILEALAPIWGYIAAGIVALGGFLAMQAKARRDGRKQERQRQAAEDAAAHIETRKEIDHAIDRSRASGGSWHDRLRDHRDKR
jgi:hypothetical protein